MVRVWGQGREVADRRRDRRGRDMILGPGVGTERGLEGSRGNRRG